MKELKSLCWKGFDLNFYHGNSSYLLLVIGQKAVGPTTAGMYNYVQPIIACAVAISWGLDSFSFIKGIAVIMIFCGVYMVSISRTKEQIEAYKAKKAKESKD